MNKDLLFSVTKKDFRIDTFKSGGKGGQHQNTTDSGVRITHIESGAVGESRSEKSQHRNKKLALNRLVETTKWKVWLNKKVYETVSKKTIEESVDEQMSEDNLKVEVQENGRWINETL